MRFPIAFLLTAVMSGLATPLAFALSPEQAGQIAAGELDDRIKTLNAVVAEADTALEPFVKALLDETVKTSAGKAYIVADGKTVEAASGRPAVLPADAEDTVTNNRMRRELESAIAVLKLVSPDRAVRAAAITGLKDQVDEGKLGLIDKATTAETDPELKARLEESIRSRRRGGSVHARTFQTCTYHQVSCDVRTNRSSLSNHRIYTLLNKPSEEGLEMQRITRRKTPLFVAFR